MFLLYRVKYGSPIHFSAFLAVDSFAPCSSERLEKLGLRIGTKARGKHKVRLLRLLALWFLIYMCNRRNNIENTKCNKKKQGRLHGEWVSCGIYSRTPYSRGHHIFVVVSDKTPEQTYLLIFIVAYRHQEQKVQKVYRAAKHIRFEFCLFLLLEAKWVKKDQHR